MTEPISFDQFFRQYYASVHRLCRGYTPDPAEAEDLVQETFAAAWSSWNRFRHEASRSTWLYRIAVNTCLGSIRKKQVRQRALSHAEAEISHVPEMPNEGAAKVEALYHAVGRLQETDRLIIMLVLEGLSYAEIAAATGIQEGTLAVRAHRIRKQLHEILINDERI